MLKKQFIKIMLQCNLISGDMMLIGIFENPDRALEFLLQGMISIRDHSYVKAQDNAVIKLNNYISI